MNRVEYKNNDYYLKNNSFPSNKNIYEVTSAQLKGKNINYNTLDKKNNNIDTPYSISTKPTATTQSTSTTKPTPTTQSTRKPSSTITNRSSSFGTNIPTTVFRGTDGNIFRGTAGSILNSTNNLVSSLIPNSQCTQLSSFSSVNGVSNKGITSDVCPSPIISTIQTHVNNGLASIDTLGNVTFKNLPVQPLTTSININPINIGFTGFTGNRGFTGFTGFTGNRGFTGFTGFGGSTGFTGFTGFGGSTGFIESKNTSKAISSTLSQCKDENQICFYESYEGITSIKNLQEIVNKQSSLSKPVGTSQWIGADKSFNVGYNKITVAVLYSYTVSVPMGTSFTLFTTNKGYVFVNDVMYMINNNIGSNLNILGNIPVPKGNIEINILLPANSGILINNNSLLNTNTNWKSKTYDLKNGGLEFSELDPLDFVNEELKKRIVSKKQNVYIIKDLTIPLNVTVDSASALISNNSLYKSYKDSDLDIKNGDLNIKSVVYSPIEDLYVNGTNSTVSFAIYGSNKFDVYLKSNNNEPLKLTNSQIFNKISVNSSITLNSLSITQRLEKGNCHLYVVAPENTLIYIPYFKIDGINDVFSNKELSKSADYVDVNKINITTQFWKYVYVNIPYIQFDYKLFYSNIHSKFSIIETYVNNNNYKRIDNLNFVILVGSLSKYVSILFGYVHLIMSLMYTRF